MMFQMGTTFRSSRGATSIERGGQIGSAFQSAHPETGTSFRTQGHSRSEARSYLSFPRPEARAPQTGKWCTPDRKDIPTKSHRRLSKEERETGRPRLGAAGPEVAGPMVRSKESGDGRLVERHAARSRAAHDARQRDGGGVPHSLHVRVSRRLRCDTPRNFASSFESQRVKHPLPPRAPSHSATQRLRRAPSWHGQARRNGPAWPCLVVASHGAQRDSATPLPRPFGARSSGHETGATTGDGRIGCRNASETAKTRQRGAQPPLSSFYARVGEPRATSAERKSTK
jgi:hypothetical protein